MTYERSYFSDIQKSNGSPSGHVGIAAAFTEDVDTNVWALSNLKGQQQRHLLRIKDRRIEQDIALNNLFRNPHYLAADRHTGIG
jgi:hypothetical protein